MYFLRGKIQVTPLKSLGVDPSIQAYSSCAENRPGSGVISTFVFPLATIACMLASTVVGS